MSNDKELEKILRLALSGVDYRNFSSKLAWATQAINRLRTQDRIDEITNMRNLYMMTREVVYEELRKKGFETSIVSRAIEMMIKNLQDHITELKATLNSGEEQL